MNRRTFVINSSLGAFGTLFLNCSNSNEIRLKKNQTIACLGDSITATKNSGYVQMLQEYVDTKHPDFNITFLNWGKGSETITGLTEKNHPGPRPYLFQRLDKLLNETKVDVIFFCYGINCGIYGEPSQKLFDSYKIGVYSFLEKIKLRNIKTVLLTTPPLALETVPIKTIASSPDYGWLNPYPKYEEEVLQKFKQIVLDINHSAVLGCIDIHTPLLKNQATCYSKDPIHPNRKGHELLFNTVIDHLRF